jgi:hypothetical protein
MGCHQIPSPRARDCNRRRWSYHQPRLMGCTSNRPRQAAVTKPVSLGTHGDNEQAKGETSTHLLRLALEPLLSFIRPPPVEGRLPRLDHDRLERVDLAVVTEASLDGSHDGPTARGRVPQMLLNRIIMRLPPVERLLAQKTHDIVGALGMRFEEETGFGELVQDASVAVNAREFVRVMHLRPWERGLCAAIAPSWCLCRSWRWFEPRGTTRCGSR